MKIKFNKKNIAIHAAIWSITFIYIFSITKINGSIWGKLVYIGIIFICCIISFYCLIFFVIPNWQTNKIRFALYFFILLICYYGVGYFDWYYIFPVCVEKAEPELTTPGMRYLNRFTVWLIIFGLVAFSYYFRKLQIVKIKIQNEKETVLLKKELNFLKNQFNPHITFNFLNHIYSIANKHSKETAKAIELYSDLLRHYNRDTNDKVSLQKEVEYLNNYIKLKKILTKDVFVNLSTKSKLGNIFIYQRILITFVENAFKHGIYNKPDDPIIINLEANETEMHFFVENGINTNRKVVSSGIGLENAQQILDLRYPDKYSLISEKKNDRFYCKLKLNLC